MLYLCTVINWNCDQFNNNTIYIKGWKILTYNISNNLLNLLLRNLIKAKKVNIWVI